MRRGKRVDKDTITQLRRFPYNLWIPLYFMLKHFGKNQERAILADLDHYLNEVESMKRLSYIPRLTRMEIFYLLTSGYWLRLNEKFVMTLGRDMKPLYGQIEAHYDTAVERRARLTFLSAAVQVAWLSSFFVLHMRHAKMLEDARRLLDASDYDGCFHKSKEVISEMKLAYLKATVEKGAYVAAGTLLGFAASLTGYFGIGIGFWASVAFVFLMFLILPYRTFNQLFYS
jgi:hypothetical protein